MLTNHLKKCVSALLVAFPLILGGLSMSAQSISLNARGVTVQSALQELQKAYGYSVAVNSEGLDLGRTVTVNAGNQDVVSVVKSIFAGQDVEVSVNGKQIAVSKAAPKQQSASGTVTVKGNVSDPEGEPLIGAGVLVKGTTVGVVTDTEGNFTINAPASSTLLFTYIGFVDNEVKVGSRGVVNIVLNPDVNLLDEIVVVGYDTQKKVNLTGAVASISTEQFAGQPIVQATTALQGVAAGVTVTTGGGAPGADGGDIRIRGIGTFGGSSSAPLVLIDGVQGDLNDVDASQIDKISVLKDAASSAIYGSRAANGVILVTTKRGTKGQSSLSYRGYVGVQSPTALPDLVSVEEYMLLANEATVNDGGVPLYSDDYISHYRENNWLDSDNYPITNWQQRLLTGSGLTHNHNLVLTTSSDKVRVITSFGYLDQQGIIAHTDFQRYNFRNNMNVEILDNLHFRFDLSGSYGHRDQVQNQGSVFNFMNARDPLMRAQWSDGHYAAFTGGTLNILPMIEAGEGGDIKRDAIKLNGAAALTWEPTKWLTLEGTVAPRFVLNSTHNFTNLVTYYSDEYGTVATASNAEYSSLTDSKTQYYYGNYMFTANFHHKFAKAHEVKFLAGASYETMDERSLSGYRQEFAYPIYEVLDAGAKNEFQNAGGSIQQWALMSYFGRINYNYKERYLLEANVRFDGSSRFAEGHRWGIFPSFSAAWRMTEEPWMQSVKNVLTEFKIRGSYGTLGNQNIGSDYYPTIQTLTISSIYAGETLYPIVGLNNLANEEITWETSIMYDLGIDAAFLNKFTVTADWYHKTTDGILMQLTIPPTIGLSAPYQNAGVVRNVGWEVALGYNDSKGDFKWGVNANLSDVKNTIIDMKGTYSASGAIRNQEGSSINALYGLKCLGMIRTQEQADWVNANCPEYNIVAKPGDLMYEDIAGAYDEDGNPVPDGIIDNNDMQIIGSCIPRYTYGLTLNFGWKGINLMAQLQGVGKADAYLSSYFTQPCVQGGTFRKEHLDRWTPETPDGRFPRMSYGDDNTLNTKTSSFWMGDASYCRLKNLQLSYTLPKSVSKKIGMKNCMLYVNATNLFTFTNYYQGYDPENMYSGGTDGATTGSFASNYPLVKTYTAGVEFKF